MRGLILAAVLAAAAPVAAQHAHHESAPTNPARSR
jgi:hypothetical protein